MFPFMWQVVSEFCRSPLGKRLIGVLLATLGVSVTFNEVSESADRVGVMLDRTYNPVQVVTQRE